MSDLWEQPSLHRSSLRGRPLPQIPLTLVQEVEEDDAIPPQNAFPSTSAVQPASSEPFPKLRKPVAVKVEAQSLKRGLPVKRERNFDQGEEGANGAYNNKDNDNNDNDDRDDDEDEDDMYIDDDEDADDGDYREEGSKRQTSIAANDADDGRGGGGGGALSSSLRISSGGAASSGAESIIERDGKSKFIDITEYLTLPQSEAAAKLGMPVSTLSKRWKESANDRKWPFRRLQKIDKEIVILLRGVAQTGPNAGVLGPEIEHQLAKLLRKRQGELSQAKIRL